jgi:hypothetical protein
MNSQYKHWIKITIRLSLILFDLFIGLILGVLMMDYDDSYDESKGEYWSWDSMNTFQKSVSVGMNLWWIVNLIVLIYFTYKIIKQIRTRYNTTHSGQHAASPHC